MKKLKFVLSLLFILVLTLFSCSSASMAQKTVIYDIGQDYEKASSDFLNNYTCNLNELESVFTDLIEQKRTGDLIVVYSKCISNYPDEPYLYNNRGHIYKMLNKMDKALLDYERAISLDAHYISPYLGKISILMLQSNYDATLDLIEKLLCYDSKNASAYYYKGLTFFFIGDKQKAFENYDLAIKYSKNLLPSAYFYRGNLYYDYKKNYKKAILDFSKCLSIIKSNKSKTQVYLNSVGDVYFNRALAYYKLGDDKNMIKDLVKALEAYEQESDKASAKNVSDMLNLMFN